ncbi:alcohol dehydrogenase, partial [Pseudolycoriella hygida]
MSLAGKSAVVTGGCSGIGYEIVKKFLEEGIKNVAVLDICEANTLHLLQSKDDEQKVVFIRTDVSKKEQVKSAFDEIKQKFGCVDYVVGNAGVFCESDYERTINVNLIGILNSTYTAIELMSKKKGGQGGIILNVSSLVAVDVYCNMPAYSASKHGVIGLQKCLSDEYYFKKHGIKFITLCPGATLTPIIKDFEKKAVFGTCDGFNFQAPSFVAECVMKMFKSAKNGSIWSSRNALTMGKILQTVPAMACMKSLLMLFNVAFWATGLAVLCAGIWMQVKLIKFLELSADFSNLVPYILVGTGALILFVATLACCCTVKGQPSLLFMYGAFLAIILTLEIAVTVSIFAYKDNLSNGFDRGLNHSMKIYVESPTISADFDVMQSELQCCGSRSYKDWSNLANPIPVPKSCCKLSYCDVEDESQVYNEGCYDIVVKFINENMAMIGVCALVVTLFPIIGILLSCCLASNASKAKYEQMN